MYTEIQIMIVVTLHFWIVEKLLNYWLIDFSCNVSWTNFYDLTNPENNKNILAIL